VAELKVVLQVFRLWKGPGRPGVELDRLLDPVICRAVLGQDSPEPAQRRMLRVLDRAVANGTILRLVTTTSGREMVGFLPATSETHAILQRLRAGDAGAGRSIGVSPDDEVTLQRPTVFALWERHIGPLTPLVAEHLRDAERSYPRAWLEDAIITAEANNRRSWRYVEAVLLRWEERGAPERSVSRGL
jgi:DnaD/phage-associated family protein